MSQIIKPATAGSLPPSVAESYVTDVNSPAVPAAHVLDVIGGSTVINTAHGIQTDGSSGSNVLTVQLTNRQEGSVTTSNATPTTLISFAAAGSATVYNFEARVTAFDATDVAGGAYVVIAGARTTGAATTILAANEFTVIEEAAMVTSDIDVIATGNTVVVQVTGIAGKTIRWSGTLTYVQVI